MKKIRINPRSLNQSHIGKPMMLLLRGGGQVFGTLKEIRKDGIVFVASSVNMKKQRASQFFPIFFFPFGFFIPFILI